MATVTDDRQAIDDELEKLANQDNGAQSIEEMAEGEGEEQQEMFPLGSLSGDPRTTWKTLVKAGVPTKLECALSRAAVPMTSGLYAFGEKGEVLVTFEAGTVKNVPELGDENSSGRRKLKAAKFVQELRAVHVRDAGQLYTREQVLDLLAAGGVSDAKAGELLAD